MGLTKKRILIAEDHAILREGLRALLSPEADWEIAGEARDGREAIDGVNKLKPDIIILDLSMPRVNGLDAIKEIRRVSPGTKILVLTVHKTDEYILATFKAGVDGYLLKDSTYTELKTAIRYVLSGNQYISPNISAKIVEGYLVSKKIEKPTSLLETLTTRERGILKLIGEGYKNKDIAEYLGISIKTVEKHRANLMQKLDLHNVSDLTAYAIEKGIASR